MVARLVLGQRGAGEYGMWVSKPGIDVFSATDDQLLFGPTSYNAAPYMIGVTTGATINHNLGYVPWCIYSDISQAKFIETSVMVTTTQLIISTALAGDSRSVVYVIWTRRAE